MGVPSSTYRLQLQPGFGFAEAAEIVPYLAGLGVSHVYCSPVLAAAPGSTHGYDVVEPERLSPDLGGEAGWARLVAALREHSLGAVVDLVPNHIAAPVPESANPAWWDLLRHGRSSAYAEWFDVDWVSPTCPGKVLVPVLGRSLGDCLDRREVALDRSGPEPVVVYFDHRFPVARGTDGLPLPELLAAQHYRLAWWRLGLDELNYRRFFEVTGLVGVRAEDPAVFAATHRRVLRLVHDGEVTGLRIDHPDGLADPGGYLDRLSEATGGAWTVAEKILEPGEELPRAWACAGTTGYDVLNWITGVLTDPEGEGPLTELLVGLTGAPRSFAAVASAAKELVVLESLYPEVSRLAGLLGECARMDPHTADLSSRGLRAALEAVLVAMPVYRVYPTEEPDAARRYLAEASAEARRRLPDRSAEIDLVGRLAVGPADGRSERSEFATRFGQTAGPVMAKGLEDTAFYRWFRLVAHNEVGGDPGRFALPTADFHVACARLQQDWPATMTTLSTHDVKRSEDVRARLLVLAEAPADWADAVVRWRSEAAGYRSRAGPDPATEYLLWQTLVGAWPLPEDRAVAYLLKAVREAKLHTSWVDPDRGYETAVTDFARGVLRDDRLKDSVTAFVRDLVAGPAQVNALAGKLIQLTMPGVPDVYQGCELEQLTLVDPDNRAPVDFAVGRRLLADLDQSRPVPDKLRVTVAALRLRRDNPEWFGADAAYRPMHAEGTAADHLLGFRRGEEVIVLATRLPVGLQRGGGWGGTTVRLPEGRWRDVLTGRECGGMTPLSTLLGTLPACLLVRS
jgi:(1->4)-alpha-D-glucan 1-alpha-D-glucosylmutase